VAEMSLPKIENSALKPEIKPGARGQPRLVVEDAAKVHSVRENLE